jgi:hypothetical protein
MAKLDPFVIDSIFNGQMPSALFGNKGQFLASIGIDPDVPATDGATDLKTAGIIRPVNYAKFSSTEVSAQPLAIMGVPYNTNLYYVMADGNLKSYDSNLANPANVATYLAASFGIYYNGYIYVFGSGAAYNKVARYGLEHADSDADVWANTWGLTNITVVNTKFRAFSGALLYQNFVAIVHVDNSLYFTSFHDDGVGRICKIKTKTTTYTGDTNDGSAFGALVLPKYHAPTALCSYGNDIVVAASLNIPSAAGGFAHESYLFFWDTTSASYYRKIAIPDSACTILKMINGTLYGISGDPIAGGYRLWRYVGGESIETLAIVEDDVLPLFSSAEVVGNRLVWGTKTAYPLTAACLMAYDTKSGLFPKGLHNIVKLNQTATNTPAAGAYPTYNNMVISCVSRVQTGLAFPKFLVGAWDTVAPAYGIYKQGSTHSFSLFRSKVFHIGKDFQITNIRIPLAQAIAANMTIVPVLRFDDGSSTSVGTVINSTNYANSERTIDLTPDNFASGTAGKYHFCLELQMTGTALSAVSLPITIEVETL